MTLHLTGSIQSHSFSDTEVAEQIALELAALAGKLSAVVEWCVNNSGECLGDHPHHLSYAQRVLDEARGRAGVVS